LRLRTNGVDRITILSGGDVGIGTTDPSGYRLKVQNTGTTGISIQTVGSDSGNPHLQMLNGAIDTTIAASSNGLELTAYSGHAVILRTANAERMRITSGGNVGIGTTSPINLLGLQSPSANARVLNIYNGLIGAGDYVSIGSQFATNNANVNSEIRFGNELSNNAPSYLAFATGTGTSPTERTRILSNGITLIYSVYSQTSGAAANVIVGSDGNLFRSTSSLKYKKNVENYTKGLSEVMKLRAVTYNGINSLDGNKQYAGLIAEEVHALGLTEFVQYANDGTPDALSYQNMVALLVKGMQELKAELDTLKNK